MKAILKFFKEFFGKTDTKTQEAATKTEDVTPIVEETKMSEIDMTFVSPSISLTIEDNTVMDKPDEVITKTPTRKKKTKPAVKKMKKAPVKKAPVKKINKKK